MPVEYSLFPDQPGVILTFEDGHSAYIPNDDSYPEWQAYQAWLAEGNTPEPRPVLPLDGLKAAQLAKVNAAAQAMINTYLATYPDFERLTWATQENEAAIWQSTAPADRVGSLVPWCANAAANRLDENGQPMALDEFMARVVAKVDAFKDISSEVAGRRQGYEDTIGAATTPEEVAGVVWDFTLAP